jgi:hypothetical protein
MTFLLKSETFVDIELAASVTLSCVMCLLWLFGRQSVLFFFVRQYKPLTLVRLKTNSPQKKDKLIRKRILLLYITT